MTCPECDQDILGLGEAILDALNVHEPEEFIQFYPRGSNRGPVPSDVPADIAADYDEAALVLPLSTKASAALSRRCLQSILSNAG
jgi:hypothetical protein